MLLAEQIEKYLEKTSQFNITFKSMANSVQLLQQLDEAKNLRLELASQGSKVVLPLLQATDPIIIQRAKLERVSISQFNAKTYGTISVQSIRIVLQNVQELVRDIGTDAEKPLIIALSDNILCVQTQAALCLGIKSVRSTVSVPHLEKLYYNDRKNIMVKLAAGISLLTNEATSLNTWDGIFRTMKTWADKFIPSWEEAGKKQGISSQDALISIIQSTIPQMLASEYFHR